MKSKLFYPMMGLLLVVFICFFTQTPQSVKFLGGLAKASGPPDDESPLAGKEYVENQLIIKFAPEIGESQKKAVRTELNSVTLRELSLIGAELVELSGITVEEALQLVEDDPRVEYAEPNYIWHIDIIPNDPSFNLLWGMHNTGQTGGIPDADIDAPEAWNTSIGDSVIIGVIDTGVDTAHVDLLGNIWTNPGEIPNNGIDDDSNGYVDDIHGWDFVNWDNGPVDDHSHGTHCSGTIAAVGNNSIGVVGVCWSAKIMALKFLDAGGYGSTSDAILAVEYATMMGANLTSNSWGGGPFSQALKDAIDSSGAHGMLFVAAAGNSWNNNDINPHYPSSYDLDNIIAVAATDHKDNLADEPTWGSNYGPVSVDLGAPGVNIYSTTPGNNYGYKSGTSMATPHVSGTAALIWSEYPNLTHLQVKERIMSMAEPKANLIGMCVTGARLNAFLAIAEPDTIPPSPILDLAVAEAGGSWIKLYWTATGDDSSTGTASYYDLRYSLSSIDSSNFNSATQVPGEPFPQPAGFAESLAVTGLDFNTTYYFAIKALDEWSNPSKVSNSPWGTTLGPPDISVSPDSLWDSLFTGETSTQILTIYNTGESELNWKIKVSGLGLGIVINEIVTSDNDWIELYNGTGSTVNLQDWAVFWTDTRGYSDLLYLPEFYLNPGAYVVLSELSGTDTYDHIYLGSNIMWYDGSGGSSALLDNTGNGVDFVRWGGSTEVPPSGTEWYETTPLSTPDNSHSLGRDEMSTDTDQSDDWSIQTITEAQPNQPSAMAGKITDTGINLSSKLGSDDPDIHLIPIEYKPLESLMMSPGPWLSASPDSGAVPSGESIEVEITFDAYGLTGDDYEANIVVTSDDPDESTVEVPAFLHVTGAPDIVVSEDTLNHGIVYIGYPQSLPLVVSNEGTDVLTVTNIVTDLTEFSIDITNFALAPGEDTVVNVTFAPTAAAEVWGNLSISSDDPDEPIYVVILVGFGRECPDLAFYPNGLIDSLFTGGTDVDTLFLKNVGLDTLEFRFPAFASAVLLNDPLIEKNDTEHNFGFVEYGKDESDLRTGNLVVLGAGGPDSSGYTWIDSDEPGGPVFDFIDISTTGTLVTGLADDNYVGPFPIGFSFPFYDSSYTEFYIQSNGVINFDNKYITLSNQPIPQADGYDNLLAWCWDDLYGYTGNVYYQQMGNKLVVQYVGYGEYAGPGTVDAEVIIYSDGKILFQYDNFNNGFDVLGSTVGIENAYGTDGLEVAFNTAYLHDDLAVLFSRVPLWIKGVSPASGRITSGDSMAVEVTLSAINMPGGDYIDSLEISSNDCDNPDTLVSVWLHVTGAPDIIVDFDSLDFGIVYIGYPESLPLLVSNQGTDILTVSNIVADVAEFSVDLTNFVLPPGEDTILNVTFAPTATAEVWGSLSISSDDPDESTLTVILRGEGHICPDLWVDPDSVLDSLFTGETSVETLTVGNSGGSPLYLEVELDNFVSPGAVTGKVAPYKGNSSIITIAELLGPKAEKKTSFAPDVKSTAGLYDSGLDGFANIAADPGDILVSWPAPSPIQLAWGLGFDGSDVWVSDPMGITDNEVTVAGVLLNWFSCTSWVGSWPGDMAWDGNYIWQVNVGGDNGIYQLDPATGIVLNSIHDPSNTWDGTSQRGLAYDKKEDVFYIGGWNQDRVYKIKGLSWGNPGEIISFFDFPQVSGLAWHPAGDLWIAVNASTDYIFQVDPGTGSIISQFLAPGTGGGYEGAGLATDKSGNLWCISQATNMVYLVESGVPAYNWLAVNPLACTLGVGETRELEVSFDATGLFGGDYTADILIQSNDCDQPTLEVPAWLHVTGIPDITVDLDSLDYGNVFIGASVTDSFKVSNAGTDSLTVSNISSDNFNYSVNITSFVLNPGENQEVLVTFTPSLTGQITGTLTINSDDPDEPSIMVYLKGQGLEPPDISVSPNSFYEYLVPSETAIETLTISNTGIGDLTFDILIEEKDSASVVVDFFANESVETKKVVAAGKPVSLDEIEVQEFPFQKKTTILPTDLIDKGIPFEKNQSGIGPLEKILGEEVFGNKDYQYYAGPRTRGNLFTCTTPTTLIEHRLYLNPSASTQMWFLVYEGESQAGTYHLVSASDVTPKGPGEGWYSSGEINVPLIAGKYYMIVASFEQASNYYNQQDISPYPIPASFGELTAGAGWHWAPTSVFPPDSSQEVPSGAFGDPVAYYQTLVTKEGIKWLELDPSSGTIPRDTSLDVILTFDATDMLVGDYDADIIINSNDPDEQEVILPAHLRVVSRGDANADFVIDMSDVVYLINYVLDDGPEPKSLASGDVNCDGSVVIDDIIYLINYMFRGGPPIGDPNDDGIPDC